MLLILTDPRDELEKSSAMTRYWVEFEPSDKKRAPSFAIRFAVRTAEVGLSLRDRAGSIAFKLINLISVGRVKSGERVPIVMLVGAVSFSSVKLDPEIVKAVPA